MIGMIVHNIIIIIMLQDCQIYVKAYDTYLDHQILAQSGTVSPGDHIVQRPPYLPITCYIIHFLQGLLTSISVLCPHQPRKLITAALLSCLLMELIPTIYSIGDVWRDGGQSMM